MQSFVEVDYPYFAHCRRGSQNSRTVLQFAGLDFYGHARRRRAFPGPGLFNPACAKPMKFVIDNDTAQQWYCSVGQQHTLHDVLGFFAARGLTSGPEPYEKTYLRIYFGPENG
jgi:hypothetical protein